MASPREIKKRIKAVGNIKRITKTMQMIATSKFARAQQRATASKPYTEGIYNLVRELAAKAGNISHVLIEGPTGGPKGKHLVLVLTSDRGLCGPYNSSVLRNVMRYLRENNVGNTELEVSGRKGISFFRFNGVKVDKHHTVFGDAPKFDDVERLAQQYMERFAAGEVASVTLAYMRFLSTSRQRAEILPLLPLKPPAVEQKPGDESAKSYSAQYEFSPEPEQLLNALLPVTVKTTLFQAFTDAAVSEHVARMIAMKAATDNAGKMGKSLTRKYNRARQSMITTELTEIIGGAAALE